MGISSFSPSTSRQPALQDIIQHASDKAQTESRVSTSHLNKLLTAIRHSDEQLSYPAYQKIEGNFRKLAETLGKQQSGILAQKHEKLLNAHDNVYSKLTREAEIEANKKKLKVKNNDEIKQEVVGKIVKYSGAIQNKLDKLNESISLLPQDMIITKNKLPLDDAKYNVLTKGEKILQQANELMASLPSDDPQALAKLDITQLEGLRDNMRNFLNTH